MNISHVLCIDTDTRPLYDVLPCCCRSSHCRHCIADQASGPSPKKEELYPFCILSSAFESIVFSCEEGLNRRSVLSDCSGVTRWLLVRDEMGMMS